MIEKLHYWHLVQIKVSIIDTATCIKFIAKFETKLNYKYLFGLDVTSIVTFDLFNKRSRNTICELARKTLSIILYYNYYVYVSIFNECLSVAYDKNISPN